MRIPRSATSILVALEAIAMVIVLVLSIVHPWAVKKPNDLGSKNTEVSEEENRIEGNTESLVDSELPPETELEPEEIEIVFSEEVLAKVEAMTLEEKVAQLFVITPEALTGSDRVTMAGNATKNAINEYPVGGLVYSSDNFRGKNQVQNMLSGVQNHYMEQFETPVFLMISEQGGEDSSPLATTVDYEVEAAPSEIGTIGDSQNAIDAATNISEYLNEIGFNVNIAPNVQVYSQDTSVSSIMVAETISTFEEKGISTVMFTFTSEQVGASEDEMVVYQAGINAGCDGIMVSGATEEMVHYLRADMQYGGLLMHDSLTTDQVVTAVQAGVDMLYCPENFKEAYQAVLDAVNADEISEEKLETAVARILTCKGDLGSE